MEQMLPTIAALLNISRKVKLVLYIVVQIGLFVQINTNFLNLWTSATANERNQYALSYEARGPTFAHCNAILKIQYSKIIVVMYWITEEVDSVHFSATGNSFNLTYNWITIK